MKHLERLHALYRLLNRNEQSLKTLEEALAQSTNVSSRQIRRDLLDIEKFFLKEDEKIKKQTRGNATTWKIVKRRNSLNLNAKDLTTYFLNEFTTPPYIKGKRSSSYEKLRKVIREHVVSDFEKETAYESLGEWFNTGFYEYKNAYPKEGILDDIINGIANKRKIIIKKIAGDATTLPDIFISTFKHIKSSPILVCPIQLIYHRGSFFLAATYEEKGEEKVVCISLMQLENYIVTNQQFKLEKKGKLVREALKRRFGITQNKYDEILPIELEFSDVTGAFVQQHHWHSTQQFRKEGNNIIMSLRCGINRELMGWILQWMNNVRIIGPELLINEYRLHLEEISYVKDKVSIPYSNTHRPKKKAYVPQ